MSIKRKAKGADVREGCTVPDEVFRRAFAEVLRRYGPALAAHDKRPSRTDSCCRPDGTCDGSCERERP